MMKSLPFVLLISVTVITAAIEGITDNGSNLRGQSAITISHEAPKSPFLTALESMRAARLAHHSKKTTQPYQGTSRFGISQGYALQVEKAADDCTGEIRGIHGDLLSCSMTPLNFQGDKREGSIGVSIALPTAPLATPSSMPTNQIGSTSMKPNVQIDSSPTFYPTNRPSVHVENRTEAPTGSPPTMSPSASPEYYSAYANFCSQGPDFTVLTYSNAYYITDANYCADVTNPNSQFYSYSEPYQNCQSNYYATGGMAYSCTKDQHIYEDATKRKASLSYFEYNTVDDCHNRTAPVSFTTVYVGHCVSNIYNWGGYGSMRISSCDKKSGEYRYNYFNTADCSGSLNWEYKDNTYGCGEWGNYRLFCH